MGTTTAGGTYTAKLIDGPLEGKTLQAALDGSEPQGRIEIPANDRGKRYIYRRAEISEFAPDSGAPSAVDYRYFGADFS
ncbi:MAG: hypothetical protein FWD85_04035 [Microbacteriaceae bacterium]|nr:hypothetical protein [Microbacteriaceae bacterium]MCL2794458.1 hypothetical protein [Microbacteriaceae bacterium]